MLLSENGGVALILKEHPPGFSKSSPVHHRHQSRKPLLLEGGAQPLDIGTVGHAGQPAGQSGVDIGLDGICNDQVGLFFHNQPAIGGKKFEVRGRIDAPSVHRRLDTAAAHGLQVLLMAHKGRAEHYLVVLQQRGGQLPAELPEHIGVIGYDQYLHAFGVSPFPSFIAPVPPSTTPSCRNTARKVPKKHFKSITGPRCRR